MVVYEYKFAVDPSCATVDKYFDLMFRTERNNLNNQRTLPDFEERLKLFTKQHDRVDWTVEIFHRKKRIVYWSRAGDIKRLSTECLTLYAV